MWLIDVRQSSQTYFKWNFVRENKMMKAMQTHCIFARLQLNDFIDFEKKEIESGHNIGKLLGMTNYIWNSSCSTNRDRRGIGFRNTSGTMSTHDKNDWIALVNWNVLYILSLISLKSEIIRQLDTPIMFMPIGVRP